MPGQIEDPFQLDWLIGDNDGCRRDPTISKQRKEGQGCDVLMFWSWGTSPFKLETPWLTCKYYIDVRHE